MRNDETAHYNVSDLRGHDLNERKRERESSLMQRRRRKGGREREKEAEKSLSVGRRESQGAYYGLQQRGIVSG